METILKDYYKKKLKLEVLTLEVKEAQEKVLAHLETVGGKAEIKDAKFSVRTSPTYEYTALVDALEEQVKSKKEEVKKLQKYEIEHGAAKIVSETKIVVMTKAK